MAHILIRVLDLNIVPQENFSQSFYNVQEYTTNTKTPSMKRILYEFCYSFCTRAKARKARACSVSCWLNWPEQSTGQRRTNEEEREEVNELEQKHGGGGRE